MVTTALDYSRTTNRSVDDAAQAVQDAAREGSYGKASSGAERPPAPNGTGACWKAQQLVGACP